MEQSVFYFCWQVKTIDRTSFKQLQTLRQNGVSFSNQLFCGNIIFIKFPISVSTFIVFSVFLGSSNHAIPSMDGSKGKPSIFAWNTVSQENQSMDLGRRRLLFRDPQRNCRRGPRGGGQRRRGACEAKVKNLGRIDVPWCLGVFDDVSYIWPASLGKYEIIKYYGEASLIVKYMFDVSVYLIIVKYHFIEINLLRVIPTMAFNSSHLTFCLANLLAFYLTFYLADLLTIYLAHLSGTSIWHSFWQIFWHPIRHIYLPFHLPYLLTFYLAYLSAIPSGISIWHSIWHIFWHSIWHSIWHVFWHSIWHIYLAFYLAYLLTFYLVYLLTFYLACLLTFYLAYLSAILSGMSSDIVSGISIWHSIWHVFWHIYLPFHLAYLSGILSGRSSGILSAISSDILSGRSSDIVSGISSDILFGILSGILFGILYGFVSGRWGPVEVWRGPRRAESRRLRSGEAHSAPNLAGWGPAWPSAPARPTAIESWQWRSGEAHCDQVLAVEVRPLRSRAGSGGPARPTAIESWQRRSGEEEKEGRKGGAGQLT